MPFRYSLYILCAVFFVNFSSAHAEEGYCDDAQTTVQMNACGDIYYKMQDTALNSIYKELVALLKTTDKDYPLNYAQRMETLREAQRVWIKFRDNHCEAEALIIGSGGTISGQILRGCLAATTKDRAIELQKLLNLLKYPSR